MWYRFFGFKNADEQINFSKDMPHGSGIDDVWIIEKKHGYFKCCNNYHCMNSDGYYNGWADFSVIIPFNNPENFRVHFHGQRSNHLNTRYGLRDAIESRVMHWIAEWPEIKKKREVTSAEPDFGMANF